MLDQQQERDILSDEIESFAVHSLKEESQARALDERLAKIPGLPDGWLKQRRNMGELRCPFSGRFANQTVQAAMAKAATYDPSVGKLADYLKHKAGLPIAAPDLEAIARAEQNARWEAEMAETAAALRASREKAFAEHRAMMAQGTPKTPAHLRYVGPGGGGV